MQTSNLGERQQLQEMAVTRPHQLGRRLFP